MTDRPVLSLRIFINFVISILKSSKRGVNVRNKIGAISNFKPDYIRGRNYSFMKKINYQEIINIL